METVTIRLAGEFLGSSASLTAIPAGYPIFFDVPSGKHLTIESVSGAAFFPKDQGATVRLLVFDPTLKQALPPLAYQIPLYHQAYVNPEPSNPWAKLRDIWAMDHCLRAYVDQKLRLQLDAFRGHFKSGRGEAEIVITGFYEDVV